MVTLRCTQRLLARLPVTSGADTPLPTTTLGDWYAAPLFVGPVRWVLCASERSLLPVIVPLKPARSLPARLPDATATLLAALGFAPATIEHEQAAMLPCYIGRTQNQSVTGSLTELVRQARAYMEYRQTGDVLAVMLELSEMPCGMLGHDSPDRRTRSLLGAA
jgi:hypothetical protein